jgi:hypothetical protein
MRKILHILFFYLIIHSVDAQIFSLPNNQPDPSTNNVKTSPLLINTDNEPNFVYTNEMSGQLIIGSRGLGFNLRRAQNMTIERKRLFEFDLAYINHPKELKYKARNNETRFAKNYYFGKINTCMFLRAGVGFQNRLFRRGDRKSVEFRYNTIIGANVAMLKPIYVYLYDANQESGFTLDKHDPLTQSPIDQGSSTDKLIAGRASFFEGIEKSRFVPGLYAKFSGMLEYGRSSKELKAIELGVIVDGFIRPLDIMKLYNKEQVVVSLYASFVFGKKWF